MIPAIADVAFYAWCASQLACFVVCWLLWRSRERWRKAAGAHKPRRAVKAKTIFMPIYHAPRDSVIELTDDDLIDD